MPGRMARLFVALLALSASLGVASAAASPTRPSATSAGSFAAPDPGGNAANQLTPAALGKQFGFASSLSQWNSGVDAETEVALIKRAGGTVVRAGISWANAQPKPGPVQLPGWLSTDAIYRAAIAGGVTPIIGVLDAPTWATTPARCGWLRLHCTTAAYAVRAPAPSHIDDYAAFVTAIAQRYPHAVIQTWNEPASRYFWNDGPPNPVRMARMQCAAYQGVKSVHPHQLVTSPGLGVALRAVNGPTYLTYALGMYQTMWPRLCWDVLSLHIYSGTGGYLGDNTRLAQTMFVVRLLRLLASDHTPIWVTETGGTTTDQYHISNTDLADLQTLQVQKLLTMPDIAAVLIYSLRDGDSPGLTTSSPGYGYGALAQDLTPKAGYCYWVKLAGNTYPGC